MRSSVLIIFACNRPAQFAGTFLCASRISWSRPGFTRKRTTLNDHGSTSHSRRKIPASPRHHATLASCATATRSPLTEPPLKSASAPNSTSRSRHTTGHRRATPHPCRCFPSSGPTRPTASTSREENKSRAAPSNAFGPSTFPQSRSLLEVVQRSMLFPTRADRTCGSTCSPFAVST